MNSINKVILFVFLLSGITLFLYWNNLRACLNLLNSNFNDYPQ